MSVDFTNKTTRILMIIAGVLVVATAGTIVYYGQNQNQDTGVTVENLVGKTKDEVISWRDENKLTEDQLTFSYIYDEEVAEDTVLSQSIDADTVMKKEDVLEVSLSNGPDPDAEVQLIDFTGKKKDEITKWFDDNLFTNVQYAFQESKDVETDTYISMTPASGKVKRSDEIKVILSTGSSDTQADVTVPDFSTYTKANIQAWGTTNKVTVVFKTQSSDTVASGKLISQSVKAGTSVKSGTSITITLSSGKGITVENFTGKTKTEAQTWITKNNLKVTLSEVYSDTASGQVVSQSPTSGTVSEGTSVTISVSAGQVPVSDCTGQTQTSFVNYLNGLNSAKNSSAKISYSVTEQQSDSTAGTILSQTLNGTKQTDTVYCAPGSKIVITVAVGKPVDVANKAGVSESDFKSYLSSIGMGIGTRSETYSDSVGAGLIISNDTGSKAKGTTINYTVSKGAYTVDSSLYAAGASYSTLSSAVSTANAYGAGYSLSKKSMNSNTYTSGQIISCSASGKSIACDVSSGRVATVPNVVGKTVEAATNLLKEAGFSVSTSSIGYSDTAQNIVVGQTVSAGSSAAYGSTISITYSDGPKPVVKAVLPEIYPNIYSGYEASVIKSMLDAIYSSAGFTNIKYVYLTGADNPDYAKSIKSVEPNGDDEGTTYDVNTQITVTIYSTN